MSEPTIATVPEMARQARLASSTLAGYTAEQRTIALQRLADELTHRAKEILEANQTDCQAASALVERGDMSPSLYKRLKLDERKLNDVIDGIRKVAALPDPLGKIDLARELDDGLRLYRVACPIGVILVIFEARPDALPQIVSLLIKSGNAGLLKGGSEAKHSNEKIFVCIDEALRQAQFPANAYRLLPGREEATELLKMDKHIDLVIPRGSGELVRKIQESTRIPVLGHAEGICHLYVDKSADYDMAVRLTVDAKTNYPAACNSVETLLVHRQIAKEFLPKVTAALEDAGVEVRTNPSDWSTEYSDLTIAVKTVDSLSDAIQHINEYGSGHTETIVTKDQESFDQFFAGVNSAGVYWNASTRFADGFRYGFGAEVGISTGKLHPRGPVGMDGITTYKYKLIGKGHVVADYTGDGARKFLHSDLCVSDDKVGI